MLLKTQLEAPPLLLSSKWARARGVGVSDAAAVRPTDRPTQQVQKLRSGGPAWSALDLSFELKQQIVPTTKGGVTHPISLSFAVLVVLVFFF